MGRLTKAFGILHDGHAAQSMALMQTVHAKPSWILDEEGRRMIDTGVRLISPDDLPSLSGPVKVYRLGEEGTK